MTLDFDVYRSKLVDAASDLSDRDRQEKLWFPCAGNESAAEMSTPTEMVAAFMHDSYAEGFQRFHASRLSSRESDALDRLIGSIDALPESIYHARPDEVIDNQAWRNVREAATSFCTIWQELKQ